MKINRALETCIYGTDLESMERFYTQVMELELRAKLDGRHLFFRCGPGMLLIFNPEATKIVLGDIPTHGATGQGHVAFAIAQDAYDDLRAHLHHHGVPIEREITWESGVLSVYVRDPAGNSVEFTTPALWGIE